MTTSPNTDRTPKFATSNVSFKTERPFASLAKLRRYASLGIVTSPTGVKHHFQCYFIINMLRKLIQVHPGTKVWELFGILA